MTFIDELTSVILVQERVQLRNGTWSDYYFDVRRLFGHPHLRSIITNLLADIVPAQTTYLAGKGIGGYSFAALVAQQRKLPFVLSRDAPKEYGLHKLLEGILPGQTDNVAIVDDVITSGGSIKETRAALLATGATKYTAVAVIQRGIPTLNIPFRTLYRADGMTLTAL